jgi:cytoskeleton protein RodZ
VTESIVNTESDALEISELPGAILRATREAQGLTIGEIAGALKFSSRQIEALETDSYDQLHGKTFLRGFIRSYARMLKLAPEPLLALLDTEITPVAEQVVPPDNMGETDPQPFYRRHGLALLILIAGFLVVAATYLYLHGVGSDEKQAPPEVGPVTSGAGDRGSSHGLTLAQSDVSAVSASGTRQTDVALPVTQTLPMLVFEFTDRSWLEVKDGSGQILLTGEFPAGGKQTATGKPPYQVWVGKASAVTVTYGDRLVDLQPYTREEVARLTLE